MVVAGTGTCSTSRTSSPFIKLSSVSVLYDKDILFINSVIYGKYILFINSVLYDKDILFINSVL